MAEDGENTNASLQSDEIQALSSIFDKEWVLEDPVERVYSIQISNLSGNSVYLQVILPEQYPRECPPIYRISAPWMSRDSKNNLCSEIEDVYCQNPGESIIFLWIEKIREFIERCSTHNSTIQIESPVKYEDAELFVKKQLCELGESENLSATECSADELPVIHHGEPIKDRKSVFQAHAAKVISVDQVNQVLRSLKENRKIATATHNMFAYRISRGDQNSFIRDCDDDGETKAGSVLLHLLEVLRASDVLVMVSRWYGGVHLGSDRFKHISNTARSVLQASHFLPEEVQPPTPKKSSKR